MCNIDVGVIHMIIRGCFTQLVANRWSDSYNHQYKTQPVSWCYVVGVVARKVVLFVGKICSSWFLVNCGFSINIFFFESIILYSAFLMKLISIQ